MVQWKILQTLKEKKSAEEVVKLILKNRHITYKKQIDEFLNPPRPDNLDPSSLGVGKRELNRATKRIKKAIEAEESIIVYGDYDADGICGTAILWEALDQLGARSLPYIPKRLKEGYGLSIQGIKNVKCQMSNVKLIITVDNGITANEAVAYAQKKGVEVIITDHHVSPEDLPQAFAIVHTTELSGSGVAWVLAKHLVRHLRGGEGSGLELVALGTIADLTSLTGPNRSLVKYGLRELNRTRRIGLLALLEGAGLSKGKVKAWEVSFIIAPRLNATGRLADAMDSLRLLCTRDPVRAKKLAKKLGEENQRRQRLAERTFLRAKSLLSPPFPKLLFVASRDYHEGIVGLVAGDLVKEFYRPAVVVSTNEEFSKGSARSIEGFNIIGAIRRCERFLLDCGGHPMAAGLTVKTANLAKLKNCLMKIAEKEIDDEDLIPVLPIDCELRLSNLTWKLYEMTEKFAPFGVGNPKPAFCTRALRVVGMRTVGNNNNHLKLKLDDPQTKRIEEVPAFDGIGFGMGNLAVKFKTGDLVDIAYTLEKNVWNEEERLELKIKDIKLRA